MQEYVYPTVASIWKSHSLVHQVTTMHCCSQLSMCSGLLTRLLTRLKCPRCYSSSSVLQPAESSHHRCTDSADHPPVPQQFTHIQCTPLHCTKGQLVQLHSRLWPPTTLCCSSMAMVHCIAMAYLLVAARQWAILAIHHPPFQRCRLCTSVLDTTQRRIKCKVICGDRKVIAV
jgi:hypothetical protein